MKKVYSAIFAASALVLAIDAAHAAAGESILRFKATRVEPDVSSDVSGVDVDGATGGEIDVTHFLTDNWALDLGVGTTKHDVNLNGNGIGSVKILPVNLLVQYHFLPNGEIRPYIGAGGNYTHFYDVSLLDGALSVDRDRFGPVAQAGLDVPLGKSVLLNVDVKKVWLDTNFSGAAGGNLTLDPWVYSAGVGFKF